MIKVTMTCNAGKDANVLTNAKGDVFVSFSAATNRIYKNSLGEKVKDTIWFNCISTQKNIAEYIKKGTKMIIIGDLSIKRYVNNRNEIDISLNINCNSIELLSQQEQDEEQEVNSENQKQEQNNEINEIDDLPF